MTILFTVLIIIVAVLLIGVVLIQNSKGGGLASNIGISTQTMGVKKTADTVEKATWYLIAAMVVLCIGSGYAFTSHTRKVTSDGLNTEDIVTPDISTSPFLPQQMPGGQPTGTGQTPQ
jgi:preprotein translocase subunit SecG